MKSIKDYKCYSDARAFLSRSGGSLSTTEYLELLEAEALARDSVHKVWDTSELEPFLREAACSVISGIRSQVRDKREFLLRPDLGRKLDQASEEIVREFWQKDGEREDIFFVVSDGLSAEAIDRNVIPLFRLLLPQLIAAGFIKKSLVVALVPFGRVALMDSIGEILGARLGVMFIGERPGLSAHDSLGIYSTYSPRVGLLDNRRNCISNVRPPQGLSYEGAAAQVMYLIRESLRREISGVELKIEEGFEVLGDGSRE